MKTTVKRMATLAAAGGLLSAGLTMALAAPAATAASACGSNDLTSDVDSLSLSPNTGVAVNQNLKVSFAGHVPNGSCAGDFVRFPIPSPLTGHAGTYPVNDPNGVTLGTMVVDSKANTVTITFNSYLQSHTDVTYSGWFDAYDGWSLNPSTTYTQQWQVGRQVTTTFTTRSCGGCSDPRGTGYKHASYDGTKDVVKSNLFSGATQSVGEVVTFTDTVGAGQSFDCSSLWGVAWTPYDKWGYTDGWDAPFKVVHCDTGGYTVTMTATQVNGYLNVGGSAKITDPSLSAYRDSGSISQHGTVTPVSASAAPTSAPTSTGNEVVNGGAQGNGTQTTTSSTPPAPSGSTTPTPTPSTSSTPPAPSGSTTPTPTPTPSTSTPSTSTTPTPLATPVAAVPRDGHAISRTAQAPDAIDAGAGADNGEQPARVRSAVTGLVLGFTALGSVLLALSVGTYLTGGRQSRSK